MMFENPEKILFCLCAVMPAAVILFFRYAAVHSGNHVKTAEDRVLSADPTSAAEVWLLPVFVTGLSLLCEMSVGSGLLGIVLFLLVWVSLEDALTKTIPNFCSFSLYVAAIADVSVGEPVVGESTLYKCIGALGALVLFTLISVLSKGAMGFGDVKLLVPFVMILGFWDFLGLFMLSLLCLLAVGLPLVGYRVVKRQPLSGVSLPYAPFFTLALLLTYLTNQKP